MLYSYLYSFVHTFLDIFQRYRFPQNCLVTNATIHQNDICYPFLPLNTGFVLITGVILDDNVHKDRLVREAAKGVVIAYLILSRLLDVERVEAVHLVELLVEVSTGPIDKEMDIKIPTFNHLGNERVVWNNHEYLDYVKYFIFSCQTSLKLHM